VAVLGCDGRQGTIAFARAGAPVGSVDLSSGQLGHARELRATYEVGASVDYLAGDVTALLLGADRFDLGFSSWVFQIVDDLKRSCSDETPKRNRIGDLGPALTVFHPTVSDVHRALVKAGFAVERLVEPGSTDPTDYEEHWSQGPELMATVPPTVAVRASA
jgi:hypothetical protein